MPLQTYISAETATNLENFIFNKDKSELSLTGAGNTASLRLQAPFRMNKVPDEVFDPSRDNNKVLIFRNRYFKEKTILKLKYKVGDKNKVCGFIFSLRGITQPDDVVGEARDTALYATTALLRLLHNEVSLPAKIPMLNPTADYNIFDFYDDDLVICVIAKDQVGVYTKEIELAILFHLNLYGFYLLNSLHNRDFQPIINVYQKNALGKILKADNTGNLIIQKLNTIITNEPYFDHYITSIVNNPQEFVSKFFLIYQCYEVLIDYVTKAEILEKVGSPGALENKSGFAIKGLVLEIGDEGYRIAKLFNQYSQFEHQSDYHIGFAIVQFLTSYRPNYEPKSKGTCGDYFYDLRNTLVHNLRICYTGTPEEISTKKQELQLLVDDIEFLAIETIVSLKL